MSYVKLFADILASTVWAEPNPTRLVWITMLAMADRDGFVGASIPGLAHIARVSADDCRRAIESLAAPDPDSRTKAYEGRRIAAREGGWVVLNYERHRDRATLEERREKDRQRQERKRQRDALSRDVTPSNAPSPNVTPSYSLAHSLAHSAPSERVSEQEEASPTTEPESVTDVTDGSSITEMVYFLKQKGVMPHSRAKRETLAREIVAAGLSQHVIELLWAEIISDAKVKKPAGALVTLLRDPVQCRENLDRILIAKRRSQ